MGFSSNCCGARVRVSTAKREGEILRKIVHTLLVLALLLPYIFPEITAILGLSKVHIYMLVATVFAAVNSFQIKKPLLARRILSEIRALRQVLINDILDQKIVRKVPLMERFTQLAKTTEERVRTFEDKLIEYIESMERDYEKRSGYIGATFGAVAIAFSQLFFGDATFYGILSLLVYDSLTAIATTALNGAAIPYSSTSIKGALLGFTSFLICLLALGVGAYKALILAVVALVSEAYFVEDNLALPISVSLTYWILENFLGGLL